MGKVLGVYSEHKLSVVFKLTVALLVTLAASALITMTLPANEAYAASPKKQTVTMTINMGKLGCDCPELTFEQIVKKGEKKITAVFQAVSKWIIDGKVVKNPYDTFYADGWKFAKHNVTVVMKGKLAAGKYKVFVDNGTKRKNLGTVTVAKKAVSKTVRFGPDIVIKQSVSVSIKMGKLGCDCPELTLTKVVKKGEKASKTVVQAVSKWTIDGKVEKDPYDLFHSTGWNFKDHDVTVLMKTKLAPGTYKIQVDNGTKMKTLGTLKVSSKAVTKVVKFA